MYNFFAFLDRMKYIRRWSLMRSSRDENVTEHTQQVAVFAHALAVIDREVFGGSPDVEKNRPSRPLPREQRSDDGRSPHTHQIFQQGDTRRI